MATQAVRSGSSSSNAVTASCCWARQLTHQIAIVSTKTTFPAWTMSAILNVPPVDTSVKVAVAQGRSSVAGEAPVAGEVPGSEGATVACVWGPALGVDESVASVDDPAVEQPTARTPLTTTVRSVPFALSFTASPPFGCVRTTPTLPVTRVVLATIP